MGMVSSQFQARLDTVRLIDALVTACIRFVYFSMEDELRSKVNTYLIVSSLSRQNNLGDDLPRTILCSQYCTWEQALM